jgi:hypothetical protein
MNLFDSYSANLEIMKTLPVALLMLLPIFFSGCCNEGIKKDPGKYDMRSGLHPDRLTIAMWDFSWLYMHYKGGAYEDYDKVTGELLERGFNTVRIDAFPLLIGKLDQDDQEITIAGDSLRNWGPSDKDRKHIPVEELIEFMTITKKKGINVILSTWNMGSIEFPDAMLKSDYATREKYWMAWDKVLGILDKHGLLDNVCYVDLDQEFPFFSPFKSRIDSLGSADNEKRPDGFKWNTAQTLFVKSHMQSCLAHFQKNFPALRFTFSLTDFWNEVRAMKIALFDVLELHIWMVQDERFATRSTFDDIVKDRGNHDYSDYMRRVNSSLKSIRPMMLRKMENSLAFAKSWSEEIAAPYTTTEAWGPWWHMDHKDLDWKWLYDWCEQNMEMASDYGIWGLTPWNYSHPYWNNWKNVEWYGKVNGRFLKHN